MKIGYLMQHGPDIRSMGLDGPSAHVSEVIAKLRARGHFVSVLLGAEGAIWHADGGSGFSKAADNSPGSNLPGWIERAARKVQSGLRLPYFNLFDSRRFAEACLRELRDVDIYLERVSWTGFGGAIASIQSGQPLVLEYNGDPLHDLEAKGIAPRGFQRWGSATMMGWTLRTATRVVASGDGWRTQAIEKWNLDPERVITVENGSSLVEILDREQLNAFNPDNADDGPTELVYLGSFQPWQGVQLLVEAFDRLIKGGHDLRLLLIGGGRGVEETQDEVVRRGLSEYVQFTGALSTEEYAPLLAGADIGVSPYCGWSEFSGLKLFDYKASGLAIVASGEKGAPSCIVEGVSGVVVPPCELEALEEALRLLASNSELRIKLGRQARLEAEGMHTWEHTAQKLEEVMIDVVSDDQNALRRRSGAEVSPDG